MEEEFRPTHYINSEPVALIKLPGEFPKYYNEAGEQVRHGRGAKAYPIDKPIPSDKLGVIKTGKGTLEVKNGHILVCASDVASLLMASLFPTVDAPIGHSENPATGTIVDNIGGYRANICRKELDGSFHQYVVVIPREFPFEVVSVQ